MSDADRVQLSFREEASYGVHPAGEFQKLRFTGESLSHEKETTVSGEIRPDRQVADLVQTGIRVSGGFDFELSYGAFDALMQYALQSAGWSSETEILGVNGLNAITIVAATGVVTDDAAGGLFTAVEVGAWLLLNNFVNAANNVPVKVIAKADNDNITVAGAQALVDETRASDGAGNNARIVELAEIENGTTLNTVTIEKDHTDHAGDSVSQYLGCAIESMELNIPADGLIGGSFAVLGKRELPIAASAAGSFADAPTNDIMNGIQNVEAVFLSDPVVNADNTDEVTSLSFSLSNNLRERRIVGELGAESIGSGKFNVTGTVQAYFENQAELSTFLNHGEGALIILLKDSGDRRLIVDIPKVKYSQGNHQAPGQNQDILLDLNFQAIIDPTDNKTMRIVRDPAE